MQVARHDEDASADHGIRITVAVVAWMIEMLSMVVFLDGDSVLKGAFILAVPLVLYVAFVQTAEGTRKAGALILLILPVMYVVAFVATGDPLAALGYVFFAQPVLYVAAPLAILADRRIRDSSRGPAGRAISSRR